MNRNARHRDNVPAARRLRRHATQSERLLWEVLRARGYRGLKFRRQHPVGPFVLDFYCESLRVAIEVDGGVHASAAQAARDRVRQRILEELWIRVVRLTAAAVEADRRVQSNERSDPSPPAPLPRPGARGAGDTSP